MGVDLASIGIELDSRPVVEGTRALDSLAETSVRVEQKVGAMNSQMNDTSKLMRAQAEATRAADEAGARMLANLQREIDLYGANRAEMERYNAAAAGMSVAAQQSAAALGAKIDALHRDEQAAREVAAAEDAATKAGERFLKNLNDQVAVLGMNTQQLHTYRAAQLGVSDAAAPLISKLAEAGAGAHTASSHIDGLSFASVGARRELLVLAHELSQGNFQKFGGSMMVLGEQTGAAGLLFSATGLAALGLVATLGGLAYATIKGALEQKHMNDALVMTGNYAGLTADSLNALAHSAVEAGGSIGEAKKVATELAGSGKFTGDQIGYITEATVAWEHATGQSIKSIIKDFESLAVQTTGNTMRATEAISRATIKLDDQYHFLTEAVYEQIRALEKEGDAKGASALATETFAKVTHDRAEEILHNLGSIARGWNWIKESIGGAVDAAGNWGKRETPGLNVAKYSEQLASLDRQIAARDAMAGRAPGTGQDRTSVLLAKERERVVLGLTDAVDKLNKADAEAIAQGKATMAQSEGVHAAARIAADDARLQKKSMTELQVALSQYADDVAKVKAANPDSALVSDAAVAAHIEAIKKAHTANVRGNDDRAKTLQDALLLEQTALEREKSIYDARFNSLDKYHKQFGLSDDDFYAGRSAARAEYIAAEAISFAKETAIIQGYRPKNAEEIAANKTKYDELLKQHKKFIDDMRNAGGGDAIDAAAAIKKQYDDYAKAIAQAGDAELKSLDAAISKQREHNAEIGKTKEQIELAKKAQEESATARLQVEDDAIRALLTEADLQGILGDKDREIYAERLAYLDRTIVKRKELAGLLADASVLQADAKAAADAGIAWKKTANTIENDLTNAILDGGGKGLKKLVRDIEVAFARMILQPIIQPIGSMVASMAYPGAPQATGVGGLANVGSSILNAGSSLLNMGGSALAGMGNLFGSSSLSAFGAGFAGNSAGMMTAADAFAGAGMAAEASAASLGSSVAAAAPYVAAIIGAVALIKSLDHSGTPHIGGAASASSAGVSTIAAESLHFEKTQTSDATEKMTAQLASGIVGILDSTALAFGKTAGYTAAAAFADDSSKDGAWGGLVISKLGQTLVDWQSTRGNGPWAPKTFADGADGQKQYLAAISADVRTALNGIGLPAWAQKMLDGLGAAPAIEDMAKVVDSINAAQKALKAMGDTLVGFSSLSEGAVSALVAAAGGIQNLAAGASAYYDGFYSPAEKMASSVKQVDEAIRAAGLAVPATTQEFRSLVESQMALGEAGAPAVAALLSVAGAFAKVHPDELSDLLNIQAQTYDALGDKVGAATVLEKQHALALQSMSPALAAATKGLWAAQAAAEAISKIRSDATGQLNSVDGALSVVQSIINRQKTLIQGDIDAVSALITKHKSLSDALHSTLDAMKEPTPTKDEREQAQAAIAAALAIAKSGGPLPDADKLKDALSVVSKDVTSQFSTYQDYQRYLYGAKNDIADLAKLSDNSLTTEEKSLEALKAQAKQLDQILASAREEVDVLKGASTTGLTLAQAMEGLRTAILSAQHNPLVDATSKISSTYTTALGRTPDTPGMDFWTGKAAEGVPIADIVKAIETSPEARVKGLYQSVLGRPADAGGLDFFLHSGASIDQIKSAMMSSDEYKKLHPFAVGTNYVPATMPALIHEGERIIPAADNRQLMARLSSPSDNNAELVTEIRSLRAEVAALRKDNSAENLSIARHSMKTASLLDAVVYGETPITTKAAG
jgi:phage-related minor tail protein